MRKIIVSMVIAICCLTSCKQKSENNMDIFVDDLIAKMTLKEKIGQLNLPAAGDIVTGQEKSDISTDRFEKGEIGGLFNLKGVEQISAIQHVAVEKSRLGIPLIFGMDVIHGYETIFPIPLGLSCTWNIEGIKQSAQIAAEEAAADGIAWTFSPMVDITHDARWGRVSEGSGEDPYLGELIAAAMVQGYQGSDLALPNTIMACVKHFALYGAAEAGRDYNSVDMSRVRMFNEYMGPYKAGVDAGAGSIMASFNDIDGIPATGNKWLLTNVLRDMWGFNGFVVTDYTGIPEMIAHGVGNREEVTVQAFNAGVDMDMVGECFNDILEDAVKQGLVSEETINDACRRILEAKYKLGLFEDPYRYLDASRRAKVIFTPEHRAVARKLAAESFVLLKNDNNILPLNKTGKIAVIGPLANTSSNMVGTWAVSATPNSAITVVEGLKSVVGNQAEILYAKGSNLMHDSIYEKNATMFGRELNRDNRTAKELIDEALRVASQADVIVATLGESSEMSGESSSRTNLDIPDAQHELLQALLQTGKPVILVLFTGRPLTLTWEDEHVPAILNVWFGGTEAGYAIGDVLFGDINPSGKLTMSFPRSVGQLPLFYAQKNTGRPTENNSFIKFRSSYLDERNDALYPFGYGLSYTSYNYGDITLSSNEMNQDTKITVTIPVTNTGSRDGEEVVQLYLRDMVASITRPVKELKAFKKVKIAAGATENVQFEIDINMLKFYNSNLEYVSEPGEFSIMIGPNSRDLKSSKFILK